MFIPCTFGAGLEQLVWLAALSLQHFSECEANRVQNNCHGSYRELNHDSILSVCCTLTEFSAHWDACNQRLSVSYCTYF